MVSAATWEPKHPTEATLEELETVERIRIGVLELRALLAVRKELASGEIEQYEGALIEGRKFLDMNSTIVCRTIGCIGGWMAIKLGVIGDDAIRRYVRSTKTTLSPLTHLFYPVDLPDEWSAITPVMAVQAIDNFLQGGDPKWEQVWNAAH